ncbi:MAG: hypothetical protein ABIN37_18895 [Burkholderiaceae bacterium]
MTTSDNVVHGFVNTKNGGDRLDVGATHRALAQLHNAAMIGGVVCGSKPSLPHKSMASLACYEVYPENRDDHESEQRRGLPQFFGNCPRPPEFKANFYRLAFSILGFPQATRGSGVFCVCHSGIKVCNTGHLSRRFRSALCSQKIMENSS